MGAPLGIPAPLRHPVALTGATLGRLAGPVLDLAAGALLHRRLGAGGGAAQRVRAARA